MLEAVGRTFLVFHTLLTILSSDRLQVKGSSDLETLVTRFFHFFFGLGITDSSGTSRYPEEFAIQGIKDCTSLAPLDCATPELTKRRAC